MAADLSSSEFQFLFSQIEKGNVILFCGAGFSVDSINRAGSSPPLSGALARALAALAGLSYSDEPLSQVYKAAQKRVGTAILHEFLRAHYSINSWDSWYSTVSSFVWHRIYTTNIDDLIQKI